ncbi:hypothetical protein [Neptuniibacter halophilus]|uniref:hypothetical protein n=1 Tax=Neptuniibacter halophilus TaxID=651666 RepID=UPI002574898B|nr:hypothetical protein [Neptuniibacter halophilus]
MRLVKDLHRSSIVYYWNDTDDVMISPHLANLNLAKEWRDTYLFSLYAGEERRRSVIDRRQDESSRRAMDIALYVARIRPQGRRITDIPVTVDIDLAADKLSVYLTQST